MATYSNSLLVDVRTQPEWQKIGLPKVPESLANKPILLSWRLSPGMAINTEFLNILRPYITEPDINIFFICRSGIRSHEAASHASTAGLINCYNILDGFEGNQTGLGWKSNNLPWEFLENVS